MISRKVVQDFAARAVIAICSQPITTARCNCRYWRAIPFFFVPSVFRLIVSRLPGGHVLDDPRLITL